MKIIKQNKLWYYLRNYAIVFLGKRGGYQQRMVTLKLEAQLEYYIAHPEACEAIIKNAQQHTAAFWNKKTEELCHLMVLERYFSMIND